ncbi:hypothetical protein BDV97DRAFT_349297 [Delphinella strobiligena]|nr:hypothetical protein BDV97DRAFT_349297 [Delphinella strobiligena]
MKSTNRFKSIMNRFLSKKKGGDPPPSPPQSGKKWRKGKKVVVEEKPQLDMTTVLPSSDDFRTSLIMPSLSTRFSMLREQDDPNSKMGKASDDSVLQPRRSSRLLDFGFTSNNLNDIAEVASIKSSIRPPFARPGHDSYGSEEGYGTDNESSYNGNVMSRARPGEGNVLFGGRQKIYKVPTASTKSIASGSERGLGKVIYDDDVSMSAFQKYRQEQQRQATSAASPPGLYESENCSSPIEQDMDVAESLDNHDSAHQDSPEPGTAIGLGLSHSDSTAPSLKRSSDSTTTPGPSPGPTSTAATSVASQSIGTAVTTSVAQSAPPSASAAPPLERSMTKRRLYEQGLKKSLNDQQASTLTRLNSIQRHRSPTVGGVISPPALSHSKSIGQLQKRGFQPYALQTSSQSVNAFPSLSSMRKNSSTSSSPVVGSYPTSPLSPTMSETDEYKTLNAALEPGDRGKATAMGAFNRPKQAYDEEQYTQRVQAQLQQFNQASRSRQNSVDMARQSAESRLARFDSARQTSESGARSRSRSVSSQAEQSQTKAFNVFQSAASQNRVVHGESPTMPPSAPLPPAPTMSDTHRTFFGDISASDDEEEDIVSDFERSGPPYAPNGYLATSGSGRFTPTPLPSVSEHPALRHETPNIPEIEEEEEEEEEEQEEEEEDASLPTLQTSNATGLQSIDIKSGALARSSSEYKEIDSPTMGAKEGIGGLIRHLRKSSDQSSIYPAVLASGQADRNSRAIANRNSTYSVTNAWDLDELESYYTGAVDDHLTEQPGFVPARGQPLAPAPSKGNINASRPSTRDSDTIDGTMWQNDFKKQHTREASTATQLERQAFDDELAARQRAIQQKMKSIVESESRGTSPAPSVAGARKAFGMLRPKPSQEAMSKDASSRTHGLGAQDKYSIYEDSEANSSRIVPQGNAWAQTANAQWPLGGSQEQPRKGSEAGSKDASASNGRSPSQQPTTRERSRSRSNSIASRTRSRSRTNGYRDDFGSPPAVPQVPGVRPSIETAHSMTPTSSEGQGRLRSNSKAGGYFDHKAHHPALNGTANGRMTPSGVSPAAASPATYTSSGGSTRRPSYPTILSSHNSKSASSTTVPHVPAARPVGSLLRKKTINKADIGEPRLISSTSNVDTVDLPTARTIVQPPLIPVLNPRRRVQAQGNTASGEITRSTFSPPMVQHAATFSARPGEEWEDRGSQRRGPRAVRSQESIEAPAARFDAVGSPVMNDAGMF